MYSAAQMPSGPPPNATTTVHVEDIATGTNSDFTVPATNVASVNSGGVNPANGDYYYGGWNSAGTTFSLFAFDPTTDTGNLAGTITPPGSGGTTYQSGDLTFDDAGNMVDLAGTNKLTATLLSVAGPVPTSGTGALAFTTLTTTPAGNGSYVGIAFAADSTLYVETSTGALLLGRPELRRHRELGHSDGVHGRIDRPGELRLQRLLDSAEEHRRTCRADGPVHHDHHRWGCLGWEHRYDHRFIDWCADVPGFGRGTDRRHTRHELHGDGDPRERHGDQSVELRHDMVLHQRAEPLQRRRNDLHPVVPTTNRERGRLRCLYLHQHTGVDRGDQDTRPQLDERGGTDDQLLLRGDQLRTGAFDGCHRRRHPDIPSWPPDQRSHMRQSDQPDGDCSGSTVATLAAGQVAQFTASYVVSQADMDNGSIGDSATASGTAPSGAAVSATATASVTATQSPQISLTKSADPTTYSGPGTQITYSYAVENTGNVTLSSGHGDRSDERALRHRLRQQFECHRLVGARCHRHLHRHLHHHPGRCGCRIDLEYRHRRGQPPVGTERVGLQPLTVIANQSPQISLDQVGRSDHLLGTGHTDHLQLRGREHRQRHAEPGHGDRSDERALRHRLRQRLECHRLGGAGRRDLHRHLHHHPGRCGCRLHLEYRHRQGQPSVGTEREGLQSLDGHRHPVPPDHPNEVG